MTYESNGRMKSSRGKAKKLAVKISFLRNESDSILPGTEPTLRGENPVSNSC
jgi:hypothetical protein